MSWIATAEKALTTEQARELTLAIRDKLTDLLPMIKQAYEGRADQALGYATWHDYCVAELSGLRVPLTDRPAAVAELRQSGMSQREIGAALGISNATVSRHLNPSVTSVTDDGECKPKLEQEQDATTDPVEMPAHQEHADAALAAIDESVQHQASAPPRIEPPDPEVRERLAREREEQNSREAISRDLARCVWLLAEFGRVVDAPDKAIREWQPSQDIYPAKTTAARLRQAADYLYALAERWPQ